MTGQAEAACGRYLYALIAARDALQDYGSIGIDEGVVYPICDDQVAAVVSDVVNRRIRPERRHLAAHQKVLKQLLKETSPLPVAFGVIADGPEAIRSILSSNRDALTGQLRRIEGKLEMDLRVVWDVPDVFSYIVSTHPELRRLRDQLYRRAREPSQQEKIELGRLFDRTLNGDRALHTNDVTDMLRARCFEIRENTPRNEREVMNLACLVARGGEAEFEEGVLAAARNFDNNYSFDFSGPWPPHSFADAELQISSTEKGTAPC